MTSEEAAATVIDALSSLGVPYMLVGSLSSNYYGIPRSTQDADFVVQLGDVSVGALVERLGPQFKLEPQLSFELIQASTRYGREKGTSLILGQKEWDEIKSRLSSCP